MSGETLGWILVAIGLASLIGISVLDRYAARLDRQSRREYLNPDSWGI